MAKVAPAIIPIGLSAETMEALESLIWVHQWDCSGWQTRIVGTLKQLPVELPHSEQREYLLSAYEQVIDILDQAGLDLMDDPELTFRSSGGILEASIRIELLPPPKPPGDSRNWLPW